MPALAEPPNTPALAYLATTTLEFNVVRTRRADSVADAAQLRGVPVGAILKTIVVRRGAEDYVFVLVPGDRAIDWGKLRKHLGVRRLSLPDAETAQRVTGYERGTITPFGATQAWPVVADARVAVPSTVSIGGGEHGVSVTVASVDLHEHLGADLVDVTKPLDES
jgi:Cys-tRNA(Pro) deacylase